MKVCTQCGKEKSLAEFHKHKPRCKKCRKENKQIRAAIIAEQVKQLTGEEVKVCTGCKESKPLADFRNDKFGVLGYY